MRVLYVQYTNPGAYPPLARGAQLLAEAGAEVLMLGTHVPGLDALSIPDAAGLAVRLLPSTSDGWRGWRLKANYARYAAWVARQGSAWKPDWIYASDVLAAPVALALGTMSGGARIVYHEHDAPSLDHHSWTMRRCLAARRHLVREATVVVAPNAERARRLSAEVGGGRYVHTVWNCPRRPVALPPRKARDTNAPLNVLYCGSVNEQRLPRTVIDAIARAETPVVLQIAGYETAGSRGYIETLLRRGATIGVGQHVHALGTLSEAELYGLSDRADVGLALMPTESTDINMRHMVGASNKVFEYLAHGLVPLVSDFAEWRSAFVDPGYAMAVTPERVDSLADAFNWAADHRAEVRAIVERGFARLQHDWNYEAQFAPVMRRMLDSDTDAVLATAEREAERCAS